MIDVITAAVLHLPSTDASDRQWAASRPNRGTHARVVTSAAQPPRGWAAFRSCVAKRESHGSATARNTTSSAQGRYQFLDNQWRRGLSFMVRDRLIQFGFPRTTAKGVRVYLTRRPIATWPGIYQDIGWAEVIERGGWRHWAGGHGCNALVPR